MIDAVSPARRVAGARLGGKEGSRLRCRNGFIMVVTHGGAVEACSLPVALIRTHGPTGLVHVM